MEITVYTSEACIFCISQINWLKKNNVEYVIKSISEENNFKEFQKYNAQGTPLTVIKDGLEVKTVLGLNTFKLKRILGIK
ncbi:glutaredoxin family protein [Priestia megaterium]|uniref:glutaredoxin family protein n=1 Tax=Priestia megaterium TaxID=1404 RepID=UPI003D2A33F1